MNHSYIYIYDALIAVFWLGVTALLVVAGIRISDRLVGRSDSLKSIQTSIIVVWIIILGVATVLSVLSALSGMSLLACTGILAASVVLLVHPSVCYPSVGSGCRAFEKGQAGEAWRLAWIVVFAYYCVLLIAKGVLVFPTEYDSLAYHIPLIDQWLQAGRLSSPGSPEWSSPGNNQLFGLWMVGPFSGDFLVGLTNAPALLLLMAACLRLGLRLGLSASIAHATALMIAMSVVAQQQSVDVRNDVAVAALCMAFLNYVLDGLRQPNRRDEIIASLALGLLGGVTHHAIGHVLVLSGVSVLATARTRGYCSATRLISIYFGGIFTFTGIWYIRNLVTTGTMFFPLVLDGRSADLGGYYEEIWASSIVRNNTASVRRLIVSAVWERLGLVYLIAFLIFPVSAAWLVCEGLWSRTQVDRHTNMAAFTIGCTLIGLCVIFITTPFVVEVLPGAIGEIKTGRTVVCYGFAFFSLSTMAMVISLSRILRLCERVRSRKTRDDNILSVGLVACLLGMTSWEMYGIKYTYNMEIKSVCICVLDMFVLLYVLRVGLLSEETFKIGKVHRPTLVFVILAVWACCMYFLSVSWHSGFELAYEPYVGEGVLRAIPEVVVRRNRICVLQVKCAPYAGSYRQYRVFRPTVIESLESLCEFLEENKVDVVVTSMELGPNGRYRLINRLISEDRRFRVAFNRRNMTIYYYVSVKAL